MQFGVAPTGEALFEFCRDVLLECFGTEWVPVTGVSGATVSLEDLCAWDFAGAESADSQNPEPPKPHNQLFVVRRKDLPALQAAVRGADLHALLEPIGRSAMGAFLAGANPPQNELAGDSTRLADALRERDELLQLLVLANLRLQVYDQERNNFLERSVHDFHAPLTAISGYCGLLLEEEFGPLTPEQQRVLNRMLHGATRLSRVSDGMFHLSAAPNVDQGLRLEKADLRDCLDQALRDVALVLEDKRISIVADFDPAPACLLFEKSQIEQTFVNLLDNACKFAPRGSVIEIRGYPFFWERRANPAASLGREFERRVDHTKPFNSFRVDIHDSGPAIQAVHVHRIFDEFSSGGRGDRSGGGLGLAICRMILQRHQGRIWAEGNPSGTAFSFVLPLQQPIVQSAGEENSPEGKCLTQTQEF